MGTKIRAILTLLLLVPVLCDAHAQESVLHGAKKPSAWIKLCEMRSPPKDVGVCMTLHERADGQTGEVLISAALRRTEGEDKEYFRVMLSSRLQVERDIHATIFPKQIWEKKIREWLQKNAKLEQKSDGPNLQTFSLGLLRCPGSQSLPTGVAGCVAEVEATPDLLANLKGSGGLLVYFTSQTCNCQVAFPIPLVGFAEALGGPPTNQWHSRWPRIWTE